MKTNKQQDQKPYDPQSKVKLSITTIYPIQLPKIKFYTERTIHQQSFPSKKQQKPIPINFNRYLKNKQKKIHSSLEQYKDSGCKSDLHQSMYITNSLQRQSKIKVNQQRNKTLTNYQSLNFNKLMQKIAVNFSKQKQQKSKILFNYYNRKYLKYRCKKSIDLDEGRIQQIKKTLSNIHFLADGLKIQKMVATNKINKQIINKAKFNLILDNQGRKMAKRQEIGPWNFNTEADQFYR